MAYCPVTARHMGQFVLFLDPVQSGTRHSRFAQRILGFLVPRFAPLDVSKLASSSAKRTHSNEKGRSTSTLPRGGYTSHLAHGPQQRPDYTQYTIENDGRTAAVRPMVSSTEDAATSATRTGDRAYYYGLPPTERS